METPLERRLRIRRQAEERAAHYRLYLKTSAHGLEAGLSVIVGMLLGYFADRFFDTRPWGMLIGLGFGLAAGIRVLVRLAQKGMEEGAQSGGGDDAGRG